jgi:hypothetical protein
MGKKSRGKADRRSLPGNTNVLAVAQICRCVKQSLLGGPVVCIPRNDWAQIWGRDGALESRFKGMRIAPNKILKLMDIPPDELFATKDGWCGMSAEQFLRMMAECGVVAGSAGPDVLNVKEHEGLF